MTGKQQAVALWAALPVGRHVVAWGIAVCAVLGAAHDAAGQSGVHDWPALVDVAPAERLAAARAVVSDDSSAGLTRLWLLAHDPDHNVVGAALEAALARCRRQQDDACVASLYFFMDADVEDGPEAWRARTTLLAEQPELARAYASRETKLDVVSLLAGRLSQGLGPKAWLSALALLADDPEPDVQEAASAVLLQLEH